MPYCETHEHVTPKGGCKYCKSGAAKRSYTKQNPYSKSQRGIGIPDYGVIMTLEELKAIPIEDWTEDHWTAKRLRIAEVNRENTNQE